MKTLKLLKVTVPLVFLLLSSLALYGQEEDSLPVAGYDTTAYHPIFIQSPDGQFKLNIGMYTQFRYNANWRQDLPDSVESFSRGYNLARTRLFFEGNLTDRFYYHMRINVNTISTFEMFVAYLQWNIKNNMNIRMGRQFMALGREDWAYPQDLAAIEFSAQDFTYALWSSFGFQFHHRPSDVFRYWLGVGNGAYGGRRSFPTPASSDLALTGRAEWNVLGSNWGIYDDMLGRRGREFGILVGLGLGQVFRRDDSVFETDYKDGSQANLDFTVSGDGYQLFAHGTVTSVQYAAESDLEDYTVESFYATFGHWLSNHWFPYVRFDYASNGDRTDATEDYASPGVGISYYPFTWTNRTRFTVEYNYLGATVNNTVVEPDGQLGLVESSYGPQSSLRLQIQFGF